MPLAPRGVEAARQVARDHQAALVVRCPIADSVPGSEPGKYDDVACLSGGVHEALRDPPVAVTAVTASQIFGAVDAGRQEVRTLV